MNTTKTTSERSEELFEEIWKGKRDGFGAAYLCDHLAYTRRSLDDLNAGRITARRITGAGSTKTQARKYCEEQIAQTEEALRTRGRSDFLNQCNVAHWLREEEAAQKETTPPDYADTLRECRAAR